MAIKSGRVGVRHDQVDHYGRIKNVAGGIYSNLSAGSLVSSASAESSNVNTPSSFTGKIDLTSIKGNTIKWNQLVQNGNFADGTNNWNSNSYYRSVISVSASDGTVTVTGSNTSNGGLEISQSGISLVQGHKYFLSFEIVADVSCTITLHVDLPLYTNNLPFQNIQIEQNIKKHIKSIATASASVNGRFFITSVGQTNGGVFRLSNIILIDLTAMFGADNEPTTVEQFKSMFPLDYYEYDTGSLLSFKATALQNAFTGEEIYLPTLKYFPNGMDGVGTDYDELTNTKAATRMARVDLGTLNWGIYNAASLFYADITGKKNATSSDVVDNIKCARYPTVTGTVAVSASTDKIIGASTSNGRIFINDLSYTSASAFKQAMSGVILVYPLASPIETDIDTDLNLSLNVNEGENLQLLPLGTDTPASAPLLASVSSYKSGATGNDVEKLLGSIAQVETSPATGNHAVGDYIMYNYQLYKVTASITTGGSLVVGTNITATTVMDEFKTL